MNIGTMTGKLFLDTGHKVMYGSRHPDTLDKGELGEGAQVGTVAEAAAFTEVLLVAVPWAAIDSVYEETSDLSGKIVIDATNPYTADGLITLPGNQTATQLNEGWARGARLIKAYNSLTAGFQADAAGRTGEDRVVTPYAGNDEDAKKTVANLIEDSGFEPFDVGDAEDARYLEPPRGDSSLYGEAWHSGEVEARLEQFKAR